MKKSMKIKLFILALLLVPYKNINGQIDITTLEVVSEVQSETIKDKEEDKSALDDNQVYLNEGVIYTITDPLAISSKLNISSKGVTYINNVGNLEDVKFFLYTNYDNFIDRYEILIYDSLNSLNNPIDIIKGEKISIDEPIIWSYDNSKMGKIKAGDTLYYILKVFGKNGNFDETFPRGIKIEKSSSFLPEDLNLDTKIKESIYAESNIKTKNIIVSGANIKFYGRGLYDTKELKIDNQTVEIDEQGNFLYETLSNEQGKIYSIDVTTEEDSIENYNLTVFYPENYEFLVGIADFYLGKNTVDGSTAILENDPNYQEDFFNTGRLAFYYKKIYDKYRITAQADTWSKEIKHMFSDFNEKDPQKIFRKIDRDDIKFNYGDDSTMYSDVETEGKMYLRVDWDKSQVLWGSYNTGVTGTRFAEYNRSLYGARAEYNSLSTNTFGDSIDHIVVFASEPDTSYNRDQFLGTGGSIYYLSKSDIVVGSAKLTVELRDNQTGRLLNKASLSEGQDYEINELTGRVLLEKPLSQGSFNLTSDEIIKDSPSGSYKYYLVVDYEYYNLENNSDDYAGGVRAKKWITNNLALGGTYIKEKRDSNIEDYDLKSVDLTYKHSNGTYLIGEFSETEGNQLTKDSNWFSPDGGFDFVEQPSIRIGDSGRAYYIETGLQLSDYNPSFSNSDKINFWYSKKEKGFSTASETSGTAKEEYGAEISYQQSETLRYEAKGSVYTENTYDDESNDFSGKNTQKEVSIAAIKDLTDRLTVGLEAKYINDKEQDQTLTILENEDIDSGEAILVGTKISYDLTEQTEVYTKLQGTAMKKDGYGENNLISLGTVSQLTEKVFIEAEGSTGNRGQAVDSKVLYKYNENYEIYAGYALENEDDLDSAITFGQKYQISDRTSLYQENQFVTNNSEKGVLQTYGVDFNLNQKVTLSLLYENGKVEVLEGDVTRNSISGMLKYTNNDFTSKHRLEFAKDTGAETRELYGTTNRFKWTPTKEYRIFGVGNYVLGKGDLGLVSYNESGNIIEDRNPDNDDSKYLELGLGFAYRPIYNDRLNLITKYSYIYDDGSRTQLNRNYSEKANIVSFEGIYDLTQRLSISGKYAFRKEEVKLYMGDDWYSNTLNLYAVRLSYEVIKKWDLFGEYHWLQGKTDGDLKHGAIVGIYREINENLEFGVGYNFTEFTDDLTNLDYRSKGWFINLIGKF